MHLRKLLRRFHEIGAPDLTKHLPKIRAPEPRQITAKPGELDEMMKHAPGHMRLFILLCSQLALRFSEAHALCPALYDAEAQTIRLPVKGHKHRTFPITPEIKAHLDTAPQTKDQMQPYVEILYGHPLSARTLRNHWTAIVKRSGVNPLLRPHDLRRTTATLAYTLTKDIRAVQQLLGHVRLASTAWYLAPLQPEDLAALVQQLRMQTVKVQ